MISRFCIDHPIFSGVLSIVITLLGMVAIYVLPVEQYPNITPPEVQVTAIFNGANANTMANNVASPLEQKILGVEDMIYMYSQNSSTGNMTLNIFFEIGTNANMAQVNVQNLANQALSQLPSEVEQEGLVIRKQTPNFLTIISIQSPDGRLDDITLSNYANINIANELDLIPGISSIYVIGQRDYSMRIWLRPDHMAQLGLTTSDVVQAIKEQNADFGIGQLGQAPNIKNMPLTVPMSTKGRLSTPEEFENIVLRADLNGSIVYLKDVANVVLGAQDYSVDGSLDNKSSILLAVYQEYGANALQVVNAIREKMKELSKNFPQGVEYSIPYDTTLFIKSSIREVLFTILIAAILVSLVVFIFLQNIRATIIPIAAIIISIIGTFSLLFLLGFSINTLTLFATVLAIGIVVDDAIVVVENVERNMRMYQLEPKEAARKAMDEVTPPIIAIVFVLCAVFIPVAFIGGIAGQLYKQFAITISISVIFSGIVALTLSPALAAILLKSRKKETKLAQLFNQGLGKFTKRYIKLSNKLIHHKMIGLGIICFVLIGVFFLFKTTPKSFVPQEDQGYLIAIANMPDASNIERTETVDKKISEIAMKHPGVEHVVSLTGFSIIDSLARTTIGSNFIILKDWKYRKAKKLHADAILKDLSEEFFAIEDANIIAVPPPTIQGLGTVGGFEFWIENRGDLGNEDLARVINTFIEKASQRKELTPLFTTANFHDLQFYVDLDRSKAQALGVSIADVFQTLQTLVGSVYVNNFNKFGRVYQVLVQALPSFREKLENLKDMYVRSSHNKMVPLKSIITITPRKGTNLISRFNDFPAALILGGPSKGFTSNEAIIAMEEVAKEVLPGYMAYGWSGAAYQELATKGKSAIVLIAGLIMVFLILSALYENWSLPLVIILSIPFGILGAFIAIRIWGMSNDIYFQIGLITLIALSAKNAILIVEFAMVKYRSGMSIIEAALEAAKLRIRAILMTSLTFIFGVTPLVLGKGAGAASRHAVGVGVMGGMFVATFLAIFFVPFLFVMITKYFGKKEEKKEK